MEESQALETPSFNPKSSARSPSCLMAGASMILLIITWLCLFLGFSMLTKRNAALLLQTKTQLVQVQQQLAQTKIHDQERQQQVTQLQHAVQKQFPLNDNRVRITLARQLIQLAHYNLIYLRDQHSALSALHLADQQLAELSIPSSAITSLRQQLAKNIARLNAVPDFDLSHVLDKLNALQTRVTQLPLQSATLAPQNERDATDANTLKPHWMKAIQTSLHHFQQLIVIQRLDAPIEPLLPLAQQQHLIQNIQLLLQEAQWALLHNQSVMYQTNLQRVQDMVQRYFVLNAAATQTVLHDLQELEQINLHVALPDLATSLAAIDSLSKTLFIKLRPTEQKESAS